MQFLGSVEVPCHQGNGILCAAMQKVSLEVGTPTSTGGRPPPQLRGLGRARSCPSSSQGSLGSTFPWAPLSLYPASSCLKIKTEPSQEPPAGAVLQ